jgi:pRiA4b ORF-3-like protein
VSSDGLGRWWWWQHRGMPVGRVTAKTKIFEIKIELREVRPAVVRRVQVPGEMSLAGLHAVVQAAMGWTDSHLHEFEIAGARYGQPDPDWDDGEVGDEAKTKLFRVAGQGGRLGYVYDFGDGWTHTLTVEEVLAPEPGVRYPRCVSGRRACPPEDVGGPWGYDGFLAAMADPAHPEHDEYRGWVGGPFDPAAFNLDEVNEQLAGLAWRPLPSSAGTSSSGASSSAAPGAR